MVRCVPAPALFLVPPRPDHIRWLALAGLGALAALQRQQGKAPSVAALLGGAGRERRAAALQDEHAELERELDAVSAQLRERKQSQEAKAEVCGRPHSAATARAHPGW